MPDFSEQYSPTAHAYANIFLHSNILWLSKNFGHKKNKADMHCFTFLLLLEVSFCVKLKLPNKFSEINCPQKAYVKIANFFTF